MYTLSDQQIEFISNDISARGIAMVSLQHDLLDHICCIIECELEPDGDFGRFYPNVISRFYKTELREVEEETVFLLTNKHFYTMKKTMFISGGLSVALLTAGIVLKFLHLPGAAIMIVLGILLMSFIFIPIMFTLRIKENREASNRAISVIGGISAVLISLGVLFKIMHWPGANMMCLSALLIMIFVFIPVYFFSGIRNPQTKVNTIVSSIMMFVGCVLIVTLIRAPHATRMQEVSRTASYVEGNRIVQTEKSMTEISGTGLDIYNRCEAIKSFLIESDTGEKSIPENFEDRGMLLSENSVGQYFSYETGQLQKMDELESLVASYNKTSATAINSRVFDRNGSLAQTLEDLNKIQLVVLQNQRRMLAAR